MMQLLDVRQDRKQNRKWTGVEQNGMGQSGLEWSGMEQNRVDQSRAEYNRSIGQNLQR